MPRTHITHREAAVNPPTVVVVGAGLTGLRVAHLLAAQRRRVIVLERSADPGGQLRTVRFAGYAVDVGAEAIALAAGHGLTCGDGLLEAVTAKYRPVMATSGQTRLAIDGRLHPLPPGIGPTGPTRPVAAARGGILSPAGKLRAGLEPWQARRMPTLAPDADISVGRFITDRFGAEVRERIVAPMLGNLHGGDVQLLSLRACAPGLIPAAEHGRSLLRLGGDRAAMTFRAWSIGMQALLDVLIPPDIRLRNTVEEIVPDGLGGYRLDVTGPTGRREQIDAAAIVLAIPARAAQRLVATLSPPAAAALAQSRTSSVATALFAFPAREVSIVPALNGTGIMVAPANQRVLKSATFLSTKWRHLSGDLFLIRMSAGAPAALALDDAELLAGLRRDLGALTGLAAEPVETSVHRWIDTMPLQLVGHRELVARARARLREDAPGVLLAGAAVDGVGLTNSLRSAADAAAAVRTLALSPTHHP